jgi:hypothetical protein
MPTAMVEAAPRVIENDLGQELWLYEDMLYPQIGLNAIVGRPKEQWNTDPARFDEMRKGCWDIDARVADMDLDGVWASLCFPSLLAGFAGVVFSQSKDQELGLACMRAWNDWHLEVWAGNASRADHRVADPVAVGPGRRGRGDPHERGARVQDREPPREPGGSRAAVDAHRSLGSLVARVRGDRDRGLPAQRSSRWSAARSPGAPLELYSTLFTANPLATAADWLWAGVTTRFPDLQVAFSEGGLGWAVMLMDRLEWVMGSLGLRLQHVGRPRAEPDGPDAAELLVLHHRHPAHARAPRSASASITS